MKALDLFSGIGGFALGLESTGGFQTVAFCEIEPFCREVLRKNWPHVPIHEDVLKLRGEQVGAVDMICGGFPCQDISVAGKGVGIHGERSGLWREFARLVGELGPRWVLAENVGALRTRGIDRVCTDLEAQGYAVWPLVVGAWAVGAPHRRERVWIVAHRESGYPGALPDAEGERREDEGQRRLAGSRPRLDGTRWPARPGEPQHEWEEPRLVDYAAGAGRGSGALPDRMLPQQCELGLVDGGSNGARNEARDAQQSLGSATARLPLRLARRANREGLKALGNSVVPQVVAVIGCAILEAEAQMTHGWTPGRFGADSPAEPGETEPDERAPRLAISEKGERP